MHPISEWLHNWKYTDTDDVTNCTTNQLRPRYLDLTAINSDSVPSPTLSIDRNTEWLQGLSSNTTAGRFWLADYIKAEFETIWNKTTQS